MVRTTQEKNLIRVVKEPVVIFPLKRWKEIEETIEDLKDSIRFNIAYRKSRGQKVITLKKLKKKHNLR